VAADEAAAVRFAWWAAFFATLTVVAVLGIAKSAQALPSPTGTSSISAAPAPDFDEESADEAEASEDESCGVEEGEECEDESGGSQAPPECLLTRAQATIAVAPNRDRVQLRVRYAAVAPTTATVDYGMHGSKGALYLDGARKQLATQGSLRLTKTLSEAQMVRVMAAKGFTVRLRVPAAPGYCQPFFEYQLNARRATPNGVSWRPGE
jgi:hypothetical protein